MDQNNKDKKNNPNQKGKNSRGVFSLVVWALIATIGINYISTMLAGQRDAATSQEIAYSELVELVREGKIESVEFGDDVFTVTPVEGFVYTDGEGKSYDENYTLFTTIIPDGNESLMALLDEYGVEYTKPYVPQMSPILAFMMYVTVTNM